MEWAIVYATDEEVWAVASNDVDGDWSRAPAQGVQAVLFPDVDGVWQIRHQGDYFRLAKDGTVVSLDEAGFRDFVIEQLGVVKVGRMLTGDGWKRAYQYSKDLLDELRRGD